MKLGLKVVWRWARWPLGVLVVLYIGVVAYRIPFVGEKQRTEKAVEYIHAQKITIADVMGENLPPVPNKEQNDATVEGVDANNNAVRDDVELAIFEKYPNSARVRAAQLQYAMALQMELTQVFNSETFVAVLQEKSRASLCVAMTGPKILDSDNQEQVRVSLNVGDSRKKEVEEIVFNKSERTERQEKNFNQYMTSYGERNELECDLDLKLLQI